VRQDESLRIVNDDLWAAAHARVEKTKKFYLRRGNQLVGQVESTKGLYLLSGFLSCGVCGKSLIATRRGRNLELVYICREHRERGDAGCANTTGVPADLLHGAVIETLRKTFTPETFIEHMEKQAANVQAKAERAAERTNLLAELPHLAVAEQRLVKRIATIEDDALMAALKQEWNEAKAKRETAERRIAELEGIGAPDPQEGPGRKHQGHALGEEGPGRQRHAADGLDLREHSRFEGVVSGALLRGTAPFVVHHDDDRPETARIVRPTIAGGRDDVNPAVHSTEMAPHTPQRSSRPAEPWRSSITHLLIDVTSSGRRPCGACASVGRRDRRRACATSACERPGHTR
jgi:Recombinase zinc beta ribbon domain